MPSLRAVTTIWILVTTGGHCQEDSTHSLEELVYDYYTDGWLQTEESSGEDGANILERLDLEKEFIDDTDMEDTDLPAKDEFGTTLHGMMGALADIQRKGDSMLAGIRKQRQVLSELETRAAEAERRRQEEEVIIFLLEEEKEELQEKLESMKIQQKELERAQSTLEPLLSEVSTRTFQLQKFDSDIRNKKAELEEVTRKVEEVTQSLSEQEIKTSVVSVTPPAVLALLAGSIMFNIVAATNIAGNIQREDTSTIRDQLVPIQEEISSFLSLLGKQGEIKRKQLRNKQETRNKMRDKLVSKAEKRLQAKMSDVIEKRFQNAFSEEIYYDLPRNL